MDEDIKVDGLTNVDKTEFTGFSFKNSLKKFPDNLYDPRLKYIYKSHAIHMKLRAANLYYVMF